jgi:hypothetical protein
MLVAELARMVVAGPGLYRVHIKNLTGDSWPLVVTADTTIGDLKKRIHEVRPAGPNNCPATPAEKCKVQGDLALRYNFIISQGQVPRNSAAG